MDLFGIHPCHDMGRIVSHMQARDFLQELSRHAIDDKQALPMPFRLVNLLLIVACPHVVAIVHFLLWQGNLSLNLPIEGREQGVDFHHAHRSREAQPFPSGQLKLGIDPDFSNPFGTGLFLSRDSIAVECVLECEV
jgi:hypothetical protein